MLPDTDTQAEESQEAAVTTQNQSLIQQANEAFEQYLESTGRKDFDEAADQLERLQNLLRELSEQEQVVSGG
jgi:acyl-CoA reductase-like NAD-dependent aldehyde dehydrogenase